MDRQMQMDEQTENKEIARRYRSLLRSFKGKLTKTDKADIRHAFNLALEAHEGMRRKSGEPYILHPIAVAQIASEEVGLGKTSVICALLHDVVEDTEMTLEDIERAFDKKTANIINGLTKISGVDFDVVNSSLQAENFRKLLLTLTDDIRVILIKIADRLHNIRTLDSMPRAKQLKIASETSYLYAPMAHRMGLYNIKSEMEDLSMKYTDRDTYKQIAVKLNQKKRERSRFINEFIKPVKAKLEGLGFDFQIYGRPKSIHSIWSKMKKKRVDFEHVYDLFAIRIILKSNPDTEKNDCWNVYSAITDVYRPNPERLRDWISNPKANGYEALHTTVMGPKGRWVEVQIRTERMHEIAERGLAAHWKYKEGAAETAFDTWMQRIQSIIANQDANALDFVSDVKMDLFNDEIFAFTPKGDLRRLSYGATALDFAFEIHSVIGRQCIGAKVNHKLVPLSYELRNGDQVEIITSKKQRPNEEWLNFVVTGKARTAIKQALKDEKRKNGAEGKAILERKLKQLKISFNTANVDALVRFYKQESSLDLFVNVFHKKIGLTRLKELEVIGHKIRLPRPVKTAESFEQRIQKTLKKNTELIIMGEDANRIEHSFANCCNPIAGDEVFGYITVKEGIKIHKTTCPNAENLMAKYSYRIVKTKWTDKRQVAFLASLVMEGLDNVGIIQNVTNIITNKLELNMKSISFEGTDGIYMGKIQIYVNDTEELKNVMLELKSIEGVERVTRTDTEQ